MHRGQRSGFQRFARIASIFMGQDLNDFMDVCSIAQLGELSQIHAFSMVLPRFREENTFVGPVWCIFSNGLTPEEWFQEVRKGVG